MNNLLCKKHPELVDFINARDIVEPIENDFQLLEGVDRVTTRMGKRKLANEYISEEVYKALIAILHGDFSFWEKIYEKQYRKRRISRLRNLFLSFLTLQIVAMLILKQADRELFIGGSFAMMIIFIVLISILANND